MKPCLLDVHVLLALGSHDHIHHEAAKTWFKRLGKTPWATCPITECGFVRISANPKLTAGAGNIESALAVLSAQRALPNHQFWPDVYSPADDSLFAQLKGHNQITDAYLLGLCIRRKGQLATFDAGLMAMSKALLGDAKHVLLLSVTSG